MKVYLVFIHSEGLDSFQEAFSSMEKAEAYVDRESATLAPFEGEYKILVWPLDRSETK